MSYRFFFFVFLDPGFEALTEIQNLLNSNTHDPSILESLIVDASNRFFTVIPSIHPHVIRDEDDFKSKVGRYYLLVHACYDFACFQSTFYWELQLMKETLGDLQVYRMLLCKNDYGQKMYSFC